MFSTDPSISHQLRTPSDLHNLPLIPCSSRHPSLLHIPDKWQDENRKDKTTVFPRLEILLTQSPAFSQSVHSDNTPLQSTPSLDRHPPRHCRQRRSSTPLHPTSSSTVTDILAAHASTKTARSILSAKRLCSAWDCTANRTRGWGKSTDLSTCG